MSADVFHPLLGDSESRTLAKHALLKRPAFSVTEETLTIFAAPGILPGPAAP